MLCSVYNPAHLSDVDFTARLRRLSGEKMMLHIRTSAEKVQVFEAFTQEQ